MKPDRVGEGRRLATHRLCHGARSAGLFGRVGRGRSMDPRPQRLERSCVSQRRPKHPALGRPVSASVRHRERAAEQRRTVHPPSARPAPAQRRQREAVRRPRDVDPTGSGLLERSDPLHALRRGETTLGRRPRSRCVGDLRHTPDQRDLYEHGQQLRRLHFLEPTDALSLHQSQPCPTLVVASLHDVLASFAMAATWDWPAYYIAFCIALHWAWSLYRPGSWLRRAGVNDATRVVLPLGAGVVRGALRVGRSADRKSR